MHNVASAHIVRAPAQKHLVLVYVIEAIAIAVSVLQCRLLNRTEEFCY